MLIKMLNKNVMNSHHINDYDLNMMCKLTVNKIH